MGIFFLFKMGNCGYTPPDPPPPPFTVTHPPVVSFQADTQNGRQRYKTNVFIQFAALCVCVRCIKNQCVCNVFGLK